MQPTRCLSIKPIYIKHLTLKHIHIQRRCSTCISNHSNSFGSSLGLSKTPLSPLLWWTTHLPVRASFGAAYLDEASVPIPIPATSAHCKLWLQKEYFRYNYWVNSDNAINTYSFITHLHNLHKFGEFIYDFISTASQTPYRRRVSMVLRWSQSGGRRPSPPETWLGGQWHTASYEDCHETGCPNETPMPNSNQVGGKPRSRIKILQTIRKGIKKDETWRLSEPLQSLSHCLVSHSVCRMSRTASSTCAFAIATCNIGTEWIWCWCDWCDLRTV